MQCPCSAAIYVNFPYHLCSHRPLLNYRYLHKVALVVLHGAQELLPLKVAPIQPSVTAALRLQSRRDSDCQMWELVCLGQLYHQQVEEGQVTVFPDTTASWNFFLILVVTSFNVWQVVLFHGGLFLEIDVIAHFISAAENAKYWLA